MGYGPRLPAVQLASALFADRIRTTIAQGGSVFRTHPAGTTGPVMLISAGAIAFLVLSAVSIRILREPRGQTFRSLAGWRVFVLTFGGVAGRVQVLRVG